MRNGVSFIGSHLCDDFYFENDTQKLAVVDNLCTGPFENIAHFKDPVFPLSDMLFDEAHLSSRSELVGEVLDTMQIPSIEPADAGGRLMERMVEIGQVVMITRLSSVSSVPVWPLVIERGRDMRRLKVGTNNN